MRLLRLVRQLLIVIVVALQVEVRLRRWELPKLAQTLGVPLRLDDAAVTTSPQELPRWARQRMACVDLVFRRGPLPDTCLRRALVTGHRLRQLDPQLRLGVRQGEDGSLEAHAWLEVDGSSLDATSTAYQPLSQVPVTDAARL